MNSELMEKLRKRQLDMGIAVTPTVAPKKEEVASNIAVTHTVGFGDAKKNLENLFGGGGKK